MPYQSAMSTLAFYTNSACSSLPKGQGRVAQGLWTQLTCPLPAARRFPECAANSLHARVAAPPPRHGADLALAAKPAQATARHSVCPAVPCSAACACPKQHLHKTQAIASDLADD